MPRLTKDARAMKAWLEQHEDGWARHREGSFARLHRAMAHKRALRTAKPIVK